MKRKVMNLLSEHGTLPQPDALNFILMQSSPIDFAKKVLSSYSEVPLILTLKHVKAAGGITQQKKMEEPKRHAEKLVEKRKKIEGKKWKGINAKDVDADVKIIKDITGKSTCEGKAKDFVIYFRNRFAQMKKLLRARREMVGAMDIERINGRGGNGEVKVIGMVKEVRQASKGGQVIELEDEGGIISVYIRPNLPQVLLDDVIGVVGTRGNDIIYADSIVYPELPIYREMRAADEPISAAFISDIHVGNKTFLEKSWEKFSKWLNGNGDNEDLAKSVKYLVICGDAVDGIGVYPGQEKDLLIPDIYIQYEKFADMFSLLPDHIKIIILPGNHDAVRHAEPQPTFPEEIQKLFNSDVIFVGNPCHFSIHGVEVLAYHGVSMMDFVVSCQNLTLSTPLDIMKEMLKRRHLAPVYGDKTPIAPEHKDYMVIDSIPDIFVTGHLHSSGVEIYRNMVLIAGSTWQSQTAYQKVMNFYPDPCWLTLVNLQTSYCTRLKFT